MYTRVTYHVVRILSFSFCGFLARVQRVKVYNPRKLEETALAAGSCVSYVRIALSTERAKVYKEHSLSCIKSYFTCVVYKVQRVEREKIRSLYYLKKEMVSWFEFFASGSEKEKKKKTSFALYYVQKAESCCTKDNAHLDYRLSLV